MTTADKALALQRPTLSKVYSWLDRVLWDRAGLMNCRCAPVLRTIRHMREYCAGFWVLSSSRCSSVFGSAVVSCATSACVRYSDGFTLFQQPNFAHQARNIPIVLALLPRIVMLRYRMVAFHLKNALLTVSSKRMRITGCRILWGSKASYVYCELTLACSSI